MDGGDLVGGDVALSTHREELLDSAHGAVFLSRLGIGGATRGER
jgi:hypothetical protein